MSKEYNIGIYIRLSMADEDTGYGSKAESDSIGNQRMLINRFLDNHPELSHCQRSEFADDGYTGTNFHRPQFTQMMEKVKRGEINLICVKDFSRFSRDYIETGNYDAFAHDNAKVTAQSKAHEADGDEAGHRSQAAAQNRGKRLSNGAGHRLVLKVCPSCRRKMKQQFIGLQHCQCGMSWKRDIGFFERTPDMVFGLRHNAPGKKPRRIIEIRQKN